MKPHHRDNVFDLVPLVRRRRASQLRVDISWLGVVLLASLALWLLAIGWGVGG